MCVLHKVIIYNFNKLLVSFRFARQYLCQLYYCHTYLKIYISISYTIPEYYCYCCFVSFWLFIVLLFLTKYSAAVRSHKIFAWSHKLLVCSLSSPRKVPRTVCFTGYVLQEGPLQINSTSNKHSVHFFLVVIHSLNKCKDRVDLESVSWWKLPCMKYN